MKTKATPETKKPLTPDICQDFDEDCFDIEDKVYCYEFDKLTGPCPFCRKVRDAE